MLDVLGQGAFGTGVGLACTAGPGTQPAETRVPEQSGTPPLPRSSQSNTSNTQHVLFFIHKHKSVMGTTATRVRSERRFHATLTYRAARACAPTTLRLQKRNYKLSTLEWLSLLHADCWPRTWPAFTVTIAFEGVLTSDEMTDVFESLL